MQAKPILMSAPMVLATLREIEAPGTGKTQTRRIIKPQPIVTADLEGSVSEAWQAGFVGVKCPYGKPGDLLYIKETFFAWGYWHFGRVPAKNREGWQFSDCTPMNFTHYRFSATETVNVPDKRQQCVDAWWKRPAIFMPRQASRITLEIADVRAERLQDISDADAKAEGIEPAERYPGMWKRGSIHGDQNIMTTTAFPVLAFRSIWESINGPESWSANPWVWAVTFKPHLINVDQFIKARAAA